MNEIELTKIFKAFGNQNRVKIIRLLKREKELPVGEMSRRIKLSVKATSKHLGILLNIGFLENEGKNNSVYYRLDRNLNKFVKDIVELLP